MFGSPPTIGHIRALSMMGSESVAPPWAAAPPQAAQVASTEAIATATTMRSRERPPGGLTFTAARRCLWLDHAHPEHGLAADVHVVLADKRQPAVFTDPEDREAGGEGPDRVAVPHVDREVVLGHEQAAAGVDVERA